MKPEKWEDAPFSVKECWLWELDLYYDHYESSMAQTVNDILNGYIIDEGNQRLLNEVWEKVSDETFQRMVKNQIKSLDDQLTYLKTFI